MDFLNKNRKIAQIEYALKYTLIEELGVEIGNMVFEYLPQSRSTRSRLLLSLIQNDSENRYINNCIAILELMHRASIIVDDIVDADSVRRGEPAYHIANGPGKAALIPHLMCSIALKLASQLPNDVNSSVICAYQDMALAQAFDAGYLALPAADWSSFEECILPKTDRLFECLFRMAANVQSLKINCSEAALLGQKIGRLYQISNDMFDAMPGERSKRGKGQRSIGLDATIAIANSSAVSASLSQPFGVEMTLSEYENFRGQASNQSRSAKLNDVVRELIKKIDHQVQVVNPRWGSSVKLFCSWVTDAECWDQSVKYN